MIFCKKNITSKILAFIMMTTLLMDQPVFTDEIQKAKNPPQGGTLRIGMFIEPTLIHPAYTNYSRAVAMSKLIFSQLVYLDSSSVPQPDLAEKWDISEDGLTYTFYIRKDVKFHDGVVCTAEDIAFTFNAIMDPKNQSPFQTKFSVVEKIETDGPYIFRIKLKRPVTAFMISLADGILPKHLFEGKQLKNKEFLERPIGSGPFKFMSRNDKGEVTLRANQRYYKGRPNLDFLEFKMFDKQNINWSSLFRREIDLVNFLSYDQFKQVKQDPTFETFAVQSDYYYALTYDLTDPFLKNEAVRHAIAFSLNQEKLIENSMHGYGTPCYGPFHRDSFAFNSNLKFFHHNPTKAVQLLEENGFMLENNELFRKKSEKQLELRIAGNIKDPNHTTIIKNLMRQLLEVGIKVEYVPYKDLTKMKSDIESKDKKPNAYLGIFLGGLDPYNAASYWHSKHKTRPKIATYENLEVNRLIELGESTFNLKKRAEIYQKLHEKIYLDQPACFLFFHTQFHAISKSFRNTGSYFSTGMPIVAIKDFYFKDTEGG